MSTTKEPIGETAGSCPDCTRREAEAGAAEEAVATDRDKAHAEIERLRAEVERLEGEAAAAQDEEAGARATSAALGRAAHELRKTFRLHLPAAMRDRMRSPLETLDRLITAAEAQGPEEDDVTAPRLRTIVDERNQLRAEVERLRNVLGAAAPHVAELVEWCDLDDIGLGGYLDDLCRLLDILREETADAPPAELLAKARADHEAALTAAFWHAREVERLQAEVRRLEGEVAAAPPAELLAEAKRIGYERAVHDSAAVLDDHIFGTDWCQPQYRRRILALLHEEEARGDRQATPATTPAAVSPNREPTPAELETYLRATGWVRDAEPYSDPDNDAGEPIWLWRLSHKGEHAGTCYMPPDDGTWFEIAAAETRARSRTADQVRADVLTTSDRSLNRQGEEVDRAE